MYQLFHHYLGKDFTEPSGINHGIAKCRLVDMYCKYTEPDVKEAIVRAFSLPSGNLQIVIATIAFGMGLDCPNVRQVIHWGPSHDIKSYMFKKQEEVAEMDFCRVLYSSIVIQTIEHHHHS